MHEVIIPGVVVAQGRPRFSNRGGFSRAYDPPKSRAYKKVVQFHCKQNKPKEIYAEPISIEIEIHRTPPKSWSGVRKERAIAGGILPDVKPDLDNFVKGVLDGASGILYKDDNIICQLSAVKKYASEDKAVIRIRKIQEG